jgi:transposase
MRKVALDLGARKIAYCEVANGEVVERATVTSLTSLIDRIGPNTPAARVLFEAGRSSWHVYDTLKEWGHEPLMLDTTRARQLGIGQHRRKTDRIDAQTLALALDAGRLPLAHVLSTHRRELRFQLATRRGLVESRASFVTTIREIVRARGHRVPACATSAFLGKLKETKLDETTRALVAPVAVVLEKLDQQIAVVDVKLEQLSAQEPVITLLKTAPSVASVVAAAFVSVIDDAKRFRNAHQVEAYLGVVPSENSSGGKRKIGSITKQGNGYLRALLTQSAWSLLRTADEDDPLRLWGEAIAKRRGNKIAIIAVVRRLVGVLWAMWRRDAVYDPSRIGRSSVTGIEDASKALTHRAKALKRAAAKGRRPRNPKTTAVAMS